MNIVLLHGGWHGAWCWHKVVPHLQAAGHGVHVPDLPAHGRHWRLARGRTTLADMARHVCRLVDELDGPVFIVAHSRGGIVASTVAEMVRPGKVAGLAYLAAYMLQSGERVADCFRQDRDSLVRRHLRIHRATLTDSLASIDAGHSAYFSCPDRLAQTILQMAQDR